MNPKKTIAVAALAAVLPTIALAQATPAEATATFDRIRTTPAELKLHCEQLRLQGEAVRMQMKGEKGDAPGTNARIGEIQARLKGYKDAVNVVADKAVAGGVAYFKSPEGKALDSAQKRLANACIPPKGNTR